MSNVATGTVQRGSAGREFTLADEVQYNRSGPVRWIISHVVRYPLLPLALVLASIINNLGFSFIQVFVGDGFDIITQESWETRQLLFVAIGAMAAASTQGVMGLFRNYAVEVLAQRLERDTRHEFYVSLLGKSQSFHGRQHIGDIMARATNDVRMVNMMFSPGLNLVVDAALALIVPIVVILTLDIRLGLVPLLFTIALAITVWEYNRRLKPVSVGQREAFGTMNSELAEAVAGIEVVKANARESYEWQKFTGNARAFRDFFVEQGKVRARYWPMLAFSIAWGLAFFHGLMLWRAGEVSMGDVVTFVGLFGTLRFATFISIFSFNLMQIGTASARRILSLITKETNLDENRHGYQKTVRGAVEFQNVSFGYDEKKVLSGITFRINPGMTAAIVGETGSGKTTLTRLINRIFDADEGRVLVDNVDVRDWSLESLRSQISFIEQDVFLFSRTIRENIAFGRNDASMEDIERAAREAQADGFIRGFPDGYETVIGERGVTLSGGQKQRLAIARAFLANPRILILDDSTSAIDSATEDEIQRAMQRISAERTTFIITHRLSQIRWADYILVMKGGELIDAGTHEMLLERCRDYSRIFARYD